MGNSFLCYDPIVQVRTPYNMKYTDINIYEDKFFV